MEESCHPKEVIHKISEDLLEIYHGKDLVDKYAVYQHLMDYWAETMQDDLYELSADGWKAGNVVIRLIKKTKKAGKEIEKEVDGIEGLEGQLIPPQLIIQEYFAAEQSAIDQLQTDLDTTTTEKDELIEEHGGEEGVLQDVSSKKDAEIAQREYTIQAWQEYLPESFISFDKLHQQYLQGEETLLKEINHPFIENLKNGKGKITQKALKARLEQEIAPDEKKVVQHYLDTIKQVGASKKKVNAQLKDAFVKLKELIEDQPNSDHLFEFSVVIRFLELLEQETKLKADIKKAVAELEVKVIQQYPKLSIQEIKTLTVDKKWMATMESRIQTEMDAISHRLTERIKELGERYENTHAYTNQRSG